MRHMAMAVRLTWQGTKTLHRVKPPIWESFPFGEARIKLFPDNDISLIINGYGLNCEPAKRRDSQLMIGASNTLSPTIALATIGFVENNLLATHRLIHLLRPGVQLLRETFPRAIIRYQRGLAMTI